VRDQKNVLREAGRQDLPILLFTSTLNILGCWGGVGLTSSAIVYFLCFVWFATLENEKVYLLLVRSR